MVQAIVGAVLGAVLGGLALYFLTDVPRTVRDLEQRVARLEGRLATLTALPTRVDALLERVNTVEREIQAPSLPRPISADFVPSGWMGDAEEGEQHLEMTQTTVTIDGDGKVATCFAYTRGDKGWAGVYWLHPENNWGDHPGISLAGAEEIAFFARGKGGGEIVEFIAGGVSGGRHEDSFRATVGQVPLPSEWKAYSIDLTGQDLSSVIGGFAWSAPGAPGSALSFCVADIEIR